MVNYCCVVGCGRNSKSNRHLNFYTLPKQKHRQKQWLKAGGKEDLLNQDMDKLSRSLRFCSRHFPPSSIKNKHLKVDAIPTQRLPGSLQGQDQTIHDGIICNICSKQIIGFRYKCVMCSNFDLCQKCEMLELHEDHFMLRIPKSIKLKIAETFVSKCKKLIKSQNKTSGLKFEDSSDDEPITKYRKDSVTVDLPEKAKLEITNEIQRALKSLRDKEKDTFLTENTLDFINVTKTISLKTEVEPDYEENLIEDSSGLPSQAMFEDVNMKCEDDKAVAALSVVNTSTDSGQIQPVIYLKLNDVLTQFMISPSDQNAQINESNIFEEN